VKKPLLGPFYQKVAAVTSANRSRICDGSGVWTHHRATMIPARRARYQMHGRLSSCRVLNTNSVAVLTLVGKLQVQYSIALLSFMLSKRNKIFLARLPQKIIKKMLWAMS